MEGPNRATGDTSWILGKKFPHLISKGIKTKPPYLLCSKCKQDKCACIHPNNRSCEICSKEKRHGVCYHSPPQISQNPQHHQAFSQNYGVIEHEKTTQNPTHVHSVYPKSLPSGNILPLPNPQNLYNGHSNYPGFNPTANLQFVSNNHLDHRGYNPSTTQGNYISHLNHGPMNSNPIFNLPHEEPTWNSGYTMNNNTYEIPWNSGHGQYSMPMYPPGPSTISFGYPNPTGIARQTCYPGYHLPEQQFIGQRQDGNLSGYNELQIQIQGAPAGSSVFRQFNENNFALESHHPKQEVQYTESFQMMRSLIRKETKETIRNKNVIECPITPSVSAIGFTKQNEISYPTTTTSEVSTQNETENVLNRNNITVVDLTSDTEDNKSSYLLNEREIDNGETMIVTDKTDCSVMTNSSTTINSDERKTTHPHVSLGYVTHREGELGYIDSSIFFTISAVKGRDIPKIGEQVFVVAEPVDDMPFKWLAKLVQKYDKSNPSETHAIANTNTNEMRYSTSGSDRIISFPDPMTTITQNFVKSKSPRTPPPPPIISKVSNGWNTQSKHRRSRSRRSNRTNEKRTKKERKRRNYSSSFRNDDRTRSPNERSRNRSRERSSKRTRSNEREECSPNRKRSTTKLSSGQLVVSIYNKNSKPVKRRMESSPVSQSIGEKLNSRDKILQPCSSSGQRNHKEIILGKTLTPSSAFIGVEGEPPEKKIRKTCMERSRIKIIPLTNPCRGVRSVNLDENSVSLSCKDHIDVANKKSLGEIIQKLGKQDEFIEDEIIITKSTPKLVKPSKIGNVTKSKNTTKPNNVKNPIENKINLTQNSTGSNKVRNSIENNISLPQSTPNTSILGKYIEKEVNDVQAALKPGNVVNATEQQIYVQNTSESDKDGNTTKNKINPVQLLPKLSKIRNSIENTMNVGQDDGKLDEVGNPIENIICLTPNTPIPNNTQTPFVNELYSLQDRQDLYSPTQNHASQEETSNTSEIIAITITGLDYTKVKIEKLDETESTILKPIEQNVPKNDNSLPAINMPVSNVRAHEENNPNFTNKKLHLSTKTTNFFFPLLNEFGVPKIKVEPTEKNILTCSTEECTSNSSTPVVDSHINTTATPDTKNLTSTNKTKSSVILEIKNSIQAISNKVKSIKLENEVRKDLHIIKLIEPTPIVTVTKIKREEIVVHNEDKLIEKVDNKNVLVNSTDTVQINTLNLTGELNKNVHTCSNLNPPTQTPDTEKLHIKKKSSETVISNTKEKVIPKQSQCQNTNNANPVEEFRTKKTLNNLSKRLTLLTAPCKSNQIKPLMNIHINPLHIPKPSVSSTSTSLTVKRSVHLDLIPSKEEIAERERKLKSREVKLREAKYSLQIAELRTHKRKLQLECREKRNRSESPRFVDERVYRNPEKLQSRRARNKIRRSKSPIIHVRRQISKNSRLPLSPTDTRSRKRSSRYDHCHIRRSLTPSTHESGQRHISNNLTNLGSSTSRRTGSRDTIQARLGSLDYHDRRSHNSISPEYYALENDEDEEQYNEAYWSKSSDDFEKSYGSNNFGIEFDARLIINNKRQQQAALMQKELSEPEDGQIFLDTSFHEVDVTPYRAVRYP